MFRRLFRWWFRTFPGEPVPTAPLYYTLDKNGGLIVDLEGLLRSGRMDRQIRTAINAAPEPTK